MTWHVDEKLLRLYAGGLVEPSRAFAIETHVTTCADCRRKAGALVPSRRTDRVWTEVHGEVAMDRRPLERVLAKTPLPDHVVRLLTATPTLRASWFAAVALTLTFAVAASYLGVGTPLPFLVVAPLLPVAGIAAAYGPGVDPTYEIGVSAPMSGMRLLSIRAAAVLVVSMALAALGALLLPELDLTPAGWMLPSLALTAVSLAFSTSMSPVRAAGLVSGAWLGAVTLHAAGEGADRLFAPAAQWTFLAVTLVSAATFVRRRDRLETELS